MILLPVIFLAFACGPGPQFDASAAAVARGEYQEAFVAARAEPDELRRAQAEVWTRHSAGDLEGALDRSQHALEDHPDDPWLLDQLTFIALTLGREEGIRLGLLGLDRVHAGAGADSAARAKLEEYHALATDKESRAETIERSLTRARSSVLAAAILGLGVLLSLARGSRP